MMEAAKVGAWGSEQSVSQYRLHHLMVGLAPTPDKAQSNHDAYERHQKARQGFMDDAVKVEQE